MRKARILSQCAAGVEEMISGVESRFSAGYQPSWYQGG
jgi:hypothetical protein